MKTSDFNYTLPPELIAQTPLKNRSDSRLLVVDKATGAIEHTHFSNIIDYIAPDDCLVINNTKVRPSRLIGHKKATGGAVEVLLLNRKTNDKWEALTKTSSKVHIGDSYAFGDKLECIVVDILPNANRIVEFTYSGIWEEILDELGEMPLPPYIKAKLTDKDRYQTVYAKNEGSAAAPTAGLHWTPELLDSVRANGTQIAEVTLNVGLGTFRPVKVDDVAHHTMHSEYFEVSSNAADTINNCKGRVIAVGTTSARVLESLANNGGIRKHSGWTDIFIYPPYNFKCVDALITNFHLPQSTLLMLVSAFCNKELILNAYHAAIADKYRFFSFGDAMLIK
ncbi:MAG: tRNA preQ1(34) S-adenosylmethionine ribosyltransferase-isomerase QueA [Clostridiales bacterium]|nr:tRNA preQ1(34) S-adenosylmethionine ribosyltransferase-isomerase QueA [Clostridiales bacterium]